MALMISEDDSSNPLGWSTALRSPLREPEENHGPILPLITSEENAALDINFCREHLAAQNRYYLEQESRPISPIPKYISTGCCGKTWGVDVLSDDDDDSSSSAEDVDDDSSVGTELALELARWEVEWVPEPKPTEENAVLALHVVRCQQFTEYDPKLGYVVPTRFCQFNIALFDFEKESLADLGPPISTLSRSDWFSLEKSVNLISLKIIESDKVYPVSVFGTVLARDQVDFKCVYLFKRDRNDPQVITSPDDMLALTGPHRGLAATSSMFFEINLKIKGDDGDIDFSKGLIEHCGTKESHSKQVVTQLLASWMSTVQLVYTSVPSALEASLAVNILKGPSNFTIKVIAWTSGNESRIILHDSQATGTQTAIRKDGSIVLSRNLVAVPVKEQLKLAIYVQDSDCEAVPLEFELTLGHSDHDRICKQGSYELQVNVTWTSMLMTNRQNVFEDVGRVRLVV